jgi:cellulose synthase/poly-beta-1,6-N-acetylglucosamine synthase-like glycosyltransferase
VTLATPAVFRGRQPLDVVPGANVAVHRELVLALGGYDERLGAGTRYSAADDNDMGFRLLEAGCEVRHVPGAVVLHRAWRSGSDLVRLRWDYGRGKGAFYAKHLHRHDNFMFRRLTADVRRRLGKALRAVPSSPSTAAAELVSIGAVLSGTCSWLARERIPVRVTGWPLRVTAAPASSPSTRVAEVLTEQRRRLVVQQVRPVNDLVAAASCPPKDIRHRHHRSKRQARSGVVMDEC